MLYEGFCCFTWFIAAVIVSWWFRFGSIGSVLIVDTCCNTFRLCMVWNEHREPQLKIKLVTWTTCKLVVCLVKERKVLKILRSLVGVLLSGVLLSSYSPKLPYFIAAEHSVWKSSNVVATKMLKTPGTASSSGLGLETWLLHAACLSRLVCVCVHGSLVHLSEVLIPLFLGCLEEKCVEPDEAVACPKQHLEDGSSSLLPVLLQRGVAFALNAHCDTCLLPIMQRIG